MNRRFEFGENWADFQRTLTPAAIDASKTALSDMLGVSSLAHKRFLDVGCGSGLSGLAAVQLGAVVHAFDRDAESVRCAERLKAAQAPVASWTIETGDILNAPYVAGLGHFDVVYAWGVLHHTGHLTEAIDNACGLVQPQGLLYLAVYNDQGWLSRYWSAVKRLYQRLPHFLRPAYVGIFAPYFGVRHAVGRLLRAAFGGPREPVTRGRGMSVRHDLRDWIGGYPFEVATPDAVVEACRRRGFALVRLKTCGGGHGCNEFLFQKVTG